MDTMKKTLVSLACTLALALGASAQTISFAELPSVRTPTVLPHDFANLDWSGFYYVAPSWSGGGAGFRQGPTALNVAFVTCEAAAELPCFASISSAASATTVGFRPKSAIVAAGYHSETTKVSAYSHGRFVGSEVYSLTASLQTMNFPPGWGTVTQLVVEATGGTVVFYALNAESSSAIAGQSVADSAAPHQNAAPSAPLGIVDPPPPMDLPTIVEPPVAPPNIIAIGPSAHHAAASPNAATGARPADMIYEPTPSVIQKPNGNAVGKVPPDDMILKQGGNAVQGAQSANPNAVPKVQPDDMILKQGANAVRGAQPGDVVYKPGPSAIGAAQPDDMILKQSGNAVQGAQSANPNAIPKVHPDDMILKQGANAVRGAQSGDVVYKPGPSAIGAAQPDDMILKQSGNAVQGTQSANPNAVPKVHPDDMIRKSAGPNAIQEPSANAVGKAQPDDLVYKPGPTVIGTQGPSAIGTAQPD